MTSPGPQTNSVEQNVSLQIHASDSADNPLHYTATDLPAGLTINASSGVIGGSPIAPGTAPNVVVTATDSTGASGQASFSWTINPTSCMPTISSVGTFNTTAKQTKEAAGVRLSLYREQNGIVVSTGQKPIPGTRTTGGSYTFVDRSAPLIRPLRYWILARLPNGHWSWHGPVIASS